VLYGTFDGGFGHTVDAETRTYVDGTSGRTVWIHHAELDACGRTPTTSTQCNTPAPRRTRARPHRAVWPDAVHVTSFGDQATPEVTWAADGTVGLDANSTPASKDIVAGIETVAPLFHLLNGDLCYANLDVDRVRTWNNFFTNNTRSARFRPWMPAAGNHEIEKANGPIGLDAFQTYFKVPSTETDPNWPACGTRSPSARCT